ncbi:unnamed protein product [Closterium sp. Yama58-4]|nr:unnamed protein product [Closterium sp. Yama58-4]
MSLKAIIATWARRVCDPRDTKAAWAVARLLLIAEAVLCSAIIAKVPCASLVIASPLLLLVTAALRHCRSPSVTSFTPAVWFFSRSYTKIDWDAYMAQVTGFQHGERDYSKLEGRRHDTKIDWDAYMAQVTGFQHGERDYTKLEGDTGPLVYPAGFLLSFSALKWITGGLVANAQVAFLVLYLINLLMVFAIYIRTQAVPPWALVLLCLSKRVHSIFLLRLFNDCLAMAFLHASLLRLQSSRWIPAVLLFSAGVSVKMNVLLFLPPLLVIMAKTLPLVQIVALLGAAVGFQLLVGWPFISTFPQAYFGRAFDLGRVFIHFWSVNFKFVPESIFTRPLHPDHITYLMLVGNFIGIFCARSLHYQFYSWYYFSIPYLLWISPLPTPLREFGPSQPLPRPIPSKDSWSAENSIFPVP